MDAGGVTATARRTAPRWRARGDEEGLEELRLSVRYSPLDFLTFKAGAAMYQQPPDYRTGQLSPVFGNPGLKPEGAWHFTAGSELRLFKFVELDVQGYYKHLFDEARLSLASGGSDISIPGAETRYTSDGKGRAYGGEVLVRVRPTKFFQGWVFVLVEPLRA